MRLKICRQVSGEELLKLSGVTFLVSCVPVPSLWDWDIHSQAILSGISIAFFSLKDIQRLADCEMRELTDTGSDDNRAVSLEIMRFCLESFNVLY